MKKIIPFIIVVLVAPFTSLAQTSTSETFGLWVDNSSWVGGVAPPTNAANIQNVFIDGFIRREGSITSTSNFGLTVNAGDTLVITDDLTIQNGNVTVNNESVLLVLGDVGGANFNIQLNTGGNVIFAGPEASISGITTNGNGHLYVFDPTPSISGNANGSNGVEDDSDLMSDNSELFDFVTKGGVLPVELISIFTKSFNNNITLNWITGSEINNDYFEVQKSENGIDFDVIGRVEGHGNSSRIIDYSFEDKSPSNGINYYRLKQVDFDGASELSPIVVSFFKVESARISIFPNPANDHFDILMDNRFINTQMDFIITNNLGAVIYNVTHQALRSQKISLPDNIKSGIYFLTVRNDFYSETARLMVR